MRMYVHLIIISFSPGSLPLSIKKRFFTLILFLFSFMILLDPCCVTSQIYISNIILVIPLWIA